MSNTGERIGPSARLRLLAPLSVLLLTAAVYAPALGFGFVCDDQGQIVDSQPHYTWSELSTFFTGDVWHYVHTVTSNYYRPAFLVWALMNSKLFGLNSALWHASAVALHLGVTLLVYLIGLRLTRGTGISSAAALLFGVHPAHVEVAAWLSAATESLFALFSLGAILCQLHGRRVAALCLFAGALLSKETAIVLPFLLAACDWLFPADPTATRRHRIAKVTSTLAICLGVELLYAAARIHALGSLLPPGASWTPRILAATLPGVALFYLRQLLLPFKYSLFYGAVANASLAHALVPTVIVVLVSAALVWIASRSKVYAFSALLFAIPMLPALNLTAFTLFDFQHDRYLYLSSAGLCLMAATAAAHLMSKWPALLQLAVLGGVVAWLAGVTVVASGYWSDNARLYAHSLEVAPSDPVALQYMADVWMGDQRFSDALLILKKGLLIASSAQQFERVAYCYVMLGDDESAEGYLYRAISLDPRSHLARSYLADIERRRGNLKEAEAQIRLALQLRPHATPQLASYHATLGMILEAEGNLPGARGEYAAQLQENPGSADAQERLHSVERRMPVPQAPADPNGAKIKE